MTFGKFNVIALLENSWPVLAGLVKKIVDPVVGDSLIKRLAKFHLMVCTDLFSLLLIPDFCKDEFEYLVKLILAAIREDKFL